ncbi:hypothetical protein E2C01_005662 [Portunus trituberculatus]|uniref:Uncharacterized protein n=1 Tax=Portunus trituberculatus TaxID=210409 RepID=A0A5B7CUY4_PORTR|nr:hypothetical protein [Portunus trituberculatus]
MAEDDATNTTPLHRSCASPSQSKTLRERGVEIFEKGIVKASKDGKAGQKDARIRMDMRYKTVKAIFTATRPKAPQTDLLQAAPSHCLNLVVMQGQGIYWRQLRLNNCNLRPDVPGQGSHGIPGRKDDGLLVEHC